MVLPYTESIAQAMKCVFGQLSEQGRRLYAAVEAQKLPRDGQHHDPPYCFKWNPVEPRVFPHLTRALAGVILTSHTQTKTLLERATTRTGLRVVAHLWDKVYETGRKVAADFKETMRIVFDAHLGQWNYCAVPTPPDSG